MIILINLALYVSVFDGGSNFDKAKEKQRKKQAKKLRKQKRKQNKLRKKSGATTSATKSVTKSSKSWKSDLVRKHRSPSTEGRFMTTWA